MKKVLVLLSFLFQFMCNYAQVDLSYYLPEIKYDENIPSPESFFGYQIGEWHIPHSLLIQYLMQISEK